MNNLKTLDNCIQSCNHNHCWDEEQFFPFRKFSPAPLQLSPTHFQPSSVFWDSRFPVPWISCKSNPAELIFWVWFILLSEVFLEIHTCCFVTNFNQLSFPKLQSQSSQFCDTAVPYLSLLSLCSGPELPDAES